MKKQFAFILMGADYIPATHRAILETAVCVTHIRTVRDFTEAKTTVTELWRLGVGAIELCGAFGAEKARELIEETHGEVAIGYVVHDAGQDHLFTRFFGE